MFQECKCRIWYGKVSVAIGNENFEASKEKVYYTHRSQTSCHCMPGRATEEAPGLGQAAKDRKKSRPETLLGFLQEKQGKAEKTVWD